MEASACLAVLTGNYLLIILQHAQGFYAYKSLSVFLIYWFLIRHLLLLTLQEGPETSTPCRFHLCPLPVNAVHGTFRAQVIPGTNCTKSSLTWTEAESSVEKIELVSVLRCTFFCLKLIKALLLSCVPAIWWNLAAAAHLWGAVKKCEILWSLGSLCSNGDLSCRIEESAKKCFC